MTHSISPWDSGLRCIWYFNKSSDLIICIQMQAPKTASYYISPIEIGVLWALVPKQIWNRSFKWGTKCSFWSRGYKDNRSKARGQKKHLPISPVRTHAPGVSRVGRYFFQTPTLISDIFAASWPKSMFSTSFKRSTSYLFGGQSPRLLNEF